MSGEALEQAAQGGGGVTIHGGVFKKCGDVALKGHGLWQSEAWVDG